MKLRAAGNGMWAHGFVSWGSTTGPLLPCTTCTAPPPPPPTSSPRPPRGCTSAQGRPVARGGREDVAFRARSCRCGGGGGKGRPWRPGPLLGGPGWGGGAGCLLAYLPASQPAFFDFPIGTLGLCLPLYFGRFVMRGVCVVRRYACWWVSMWVCVGVCKPYGSKHLTISLHMHTRRSLHFQPCCCRYYLGWRRRLRIASLAAQWPYGVAQVRKGGRPLGF